MLWLRGCGAYAAAASAPDRQPQPSDSCATSYQPQARRPGTYMAEHRRRICTRSSAACAAAVA